jgi:hypothetical protein
MTRLAVPVVVVLLALASDGDARRERSNGWPATTRSVETKIAAKVYAQPRKRGGRLGKLAVGQRVGFTRVVATSDRCRAWVEIEPRGWVCARDVTPSDEPPEVDPMPTSFRQGTTTHVGVDLTTVATGWPFAWVQEPQPWRRRDQGKKLRAPRPTPVLAAPAADAAVVRTVEARSRVAVLEERDGFARIDDDEWVALRELHVARGRPRPDGVAATERWIDVDLEEQVMVAYDGNTPVYATLVTTGRRNGTPPGIYRIDRKLAKGTLRSGEQQTQGSWKYEDVPFVMHFRERFALHAAYWHDRFGNAASVGCVNLTPADAHWVFDWAEPALPDGWLEIRTPRGEAGTVVRIHDARHRDPPWRDYQGDPI